MAKPWYLVSKCHKLIIQEYITAVDLSDMDMEGFCLAL